MKPQSRPKVVLLGPQRFDPMVDEVVGDLGLRGPYALITAGWREREPEDEELRAHIGGESVNLELYQVADAILQRDKELRQHSRVRQTKLRELQGIYRTRLSHAMGAARELRLKANADEELIEPERENAIELVRSLDRHHLARIAAIQHEYAGRLDPLERDAVARQRERFAQQIHDCQAVLIAGGHVASLLNRLRLFDLEPILRHKPVIAWSAGAMVCSERIVLFHDSPPQGQGFAEVLDRGLGLCHGVLPLPNASKRLKLDRRVRVELFARRFFDLRPVALDPKVRVDWLPPRWRPAPGARQLTQEGTVDPWEDAA